MSDQGIGTSPTHAGVDTDANNVVKGNSIRTQDDEHDNSKDTDTNGWTQSDKIIIGKEDANSKRVSQLDAKYKVDLL